jgi:predicted TPR repeat methyltransferase
LVFTVEALIGEGDAPYRLQPHGRYAHDRAYLQTVLSDAGFLVEDLDQEVLRREAGLEVQGWLVNARRGARSIHAGRSRRAG